MSRKLFLLLLVPAIAAAQEVPPDGANCGLRSPPGAAAKGLYSPHRLPMRMFPVKPGDRYTGCQWLWIAYVRPDVWDYSSVTYYENGTPMIQRVTYPPLPVQLTIQTCIFAADGRAKQSVQGPSWRLDCHDARRLRELLLVTPKEDETWDFF